MGNVSKAQVFLREAEVHDEPVYLNGYGGRASRLRANVVIRKRHADASTADIGFQRGATGFRAIINDMDRTRYGTTWLARLSERYDHHHERMLQRLAEDERRRKEEERRRLVESQRQAITERAKKMGYRVKEAREGGKVRLVLVKRVY